MSALIVFRLRFINNTRQMGSIYTDQHMIYFWSVSMSLGSHTEYTVNHTQTRQPFVFLFFCRRTRKCTYGNSTIILIPIWSSIFFRVYFTSSNFRLVYWNVYHINVCNLVMALKMLHHQIGTMFVQHFRKIFARLWNVKWYMLFDILARFKLPT